MVPWESIEAHKEYQGLSPQEKARIKQGWFHETIEPTSQFSALSSEERRQVRDSFLSDVEAVPEIRQAPKRTLGDFLRKPLSNKQRASAVVNLERRAAGEPAKLTLQDFAKGAEILGRGIGRVPQEVRSSAARVIRGGDIDTETDSIDRVIQEGQKTGEAFRERYGDKSRQFLPGVTHEDVAQLPQNLGFTLTSMMAGLGVGVPTALLPVPGARPAAWVGGTTASGATAFRMAKDQFVNDVFDMLNRESRQNNGREMTEAEWNQVYEAFELSSRSTKYGLWEAVPEALGQAFSLGIIRMPVGKFLKLPSVKNRLAGTLMSAVSKFGSIQAEEQLTETITGKGQGGIEAEVGLREKAPTIREAFKEQAPQTFLLTAVTTGAGATVSKAYDRAVDRVTGKRGETGDPETEAQEIQVEASKSPELTEREFVDLIREDLVRGEDNQGNPFTPHDALVITNHESIPRSLDRRLKDTIVDTVREFYENGVDAQGNPFTIENVKDLLDFDRAAVGGMRASIQRELRDILNEDAVSRIAEGTPAKEVIPGLRTPQERQAEIDRLMPKEEVERPTEPETTETPETQEIEEAPGPEEPITPKAQEQGEQRGLTDDRADQDQEQDLLQGGLGEGQEPGRTVSDQGAGGGAPGPSGILQEGEGQEAAEAGEGEVKPTAEPGSEITPATPATPAKTPSPEVEEKTEEKEKEPTFQLSEEERGPEVEEEPAPQPEAGRNKPKFDIGDRVLVNGRTGVIENVMVRLKEDSDLTPGATFRYKARLDGEGNNFWLGGEDEIEPVQPEASPSEPPAGPSKEPPVEPQFKIGDRVKSAGGRTGSIKQILTATKTTVVPTRAGIQGIPKSKKFTYVIQPDDADQTIQRDEVDLEPGPEKPKIEAKFKKGDRVEINQGTYSGRHGVVSDISTWTARTAYGETVERNHSYTVKTDQGAEVHISGREIWQEKEGPKGKIVPDIEYEGIFYRPEDFHDQIHRAREDARRTRARTARARKPERIQAHQKEAQKYEQTAEDLQKAFNRWAVQYPQEAQVIKGTKQAGPQVEGKGKLEDYGLAARKTTTKNGNPVWEVSGNTKQYKDMIKAAARKMGTQARFYGPKRAWSFYGEEDPTTYILEYLPAGEKAESEEQAPVSMEGPPESVSQLQQPEAAPEQPESASHDIEAEVDSMSEDDIKSLLRQRTEIQQEREAGEAATETEPTVEAQAETPAPDVTKPEQVNPQPSQPAQSLKKAGIETVEGVKDAAKGLAELFGLNDPNTLRSGIIFDEETYKKAKPHFESAWQHAKEAGYSLTEFADWVLQTFKSGVAPYLERFVLELKGGVHERSNVSRDVARVEEPSSMAHGERAEEVEAPVSGESGKAAKGTERDGRISGEYGNKTEGERPSEPRSSSDRSRDDSRSAETGRSGEGRTVRRDVGQHPGLGGRSGRGRQRNEGPRAERTVEPADQNHRISVDEELAPTSIRARAQSNIRAIKLLRELEKENRNPSPEEKRVLAAFSGWGALAQEVFRREFVQVLESGSGVPNWWSATGQKEKYEKWQAAYGELHPDTGGLMSREEWNSARESTLNAHYTSQAVIHGLWSIADRLGFQRGTVLEPAAGIGHILGMIPENIKAKLIGIELDTISGTILKKLYPQASTQVKGFEKVKALDNSADLVISNFPFGRFSVYDPNHPAYSNWSIHNYFFARSIDSLRPGGLLIAVTSHWTMDAATNSKVREYLSQRADFVGGIRLANNVFKANAGTEVTTDILVFRKKDSAPFEDGQKMIGLKSVNAGEKEAMVNEYFADHPEMVLGEHSLTGTMRGGEDEYTLESNFPIEELPQKIQEPISKLPEKIAGEAREYVPAEVPVFASEGTKEGLLTIHEGKIKTVKDGQLRSPSWAKNDQNKRAQAAHEYLKLRDTAKGLIRLQGDPEATEETVEAKRKELNGLYDDFRTKYGSVGERGFLKSSDVEFPIAAALEDVETQKSEVAGKSETIYKKASIFFNRTTYPYKEPDQAESLEDAVMVSVAYRNTLNLPYIAKLVSQDIDTVRHRLLEKGLAFENPATGLLETPEEYFSGNVREKLKIAEGAGERYEANAEALKEVQPEPLSIGVIDFRLGSSWIPVPIYERFIKELLEVSEAKIYQARSSDQTYWGLKISGQNVRGVKNTATWGLNSDVTADWIIQQGLRSRTPAVYRTEQDENGRPKRVKDTEATQAAQDMLEKINEEFVHWVRRDQDAAAEMEKVYNERFNNWRVREYSLPNIKHFPGASHLYELRDHQKIAVKRGLQESTLFAHAPGTGKTFIYITLAMEMRRLKIASKPIIVVQQTTIEQYRQSFNKLYPGANVLIPDAEQRKGGASDNRRRLLAQIATGDWDAVVLPHHFFDGLPNDPEIEKAYLEDRLAELEELIDEEIKEEGKKSPTVKQLEARKKTLRKKIDKLLDARADKALWFEEMGVDALLVDEAHTYKRSDFVTNMGNVKGIDQDSGQKSTRFFLKAKHVRDKTAGKNVLLATGTPISNTMAEFWTLFRYIRPDLLGHYDIERFDDFAAMFGVVKSEITEHASGGFREEKRFGKYVNGPELLTLWRTGADVILTENVPGLKLPKIRDGQATLVSIPRSKEIETYIKRIQADWQHWENLTGREKRFQRHVPLVLFGEAKKVAIDPRLLDSEARDDPGSKLNKVVEEIFERWDRTQDIKGTQFVFCDNYNGPGGFNLYEEFVEKLVAKGVPRHEVVHINQFPERKRDQFLAGFRSGNIRIVIGHTEKLGIGVDAPEKCVAIHHIDAPPRPMDIEQRNARGIRQGNENEEVEVLMYGVKNTLDAVSYDRLQKKQKFINQVLRGEIKDRSFDDPSDETQQVLEIMQTELSGNPLLKEKFQLEEKVRKLRMSWHAFQDKQAHVRSNVMWLKRQIPAQEEALKKETKALARLSQIFPENRVTNVRVEGQEFAEPMKDGTVSPDTLPLKEFGKWFQEEMIGKIEAGIEKASPKDVFEYFHSDTHPWKPVHSIEVNGVRVKIELQPRLKDDEGYTWVRHSAKTADVIRRRGVELVGVDVLYEAEGYEDIRGMVTSGSGLLRSIQDRLKKYPGFIEALKKDIERNKKHLEGFSGELDKTFEGEAELKETEDRLSKVKAELISSTAQKEGEHQDQVQSDIDEGSGDAVDNLLDDIDKALLSVTTEEPAGGYEPRELLDLYNNVRGWLKDVLPEEAERRVQVDLREVVSLAEMVPDARARTSLAEHGITRANMNRFRVSGAVTFDNRNMLALVRLAYGHQNPAGMRKIVYHEAFHITARWLLPERDYSRLMKHYGGNEEKAAYGFAEWAARHKQKEAAGKPPPSIIQGVFLKLRRILQIVRNGLMRKGFTRPEDVFGKIWTKEYQGIRPRREGTVHLSLEDRNKAWHEQYINRHLLKVRDPERYAEAELKGRKGLDPEKVKAIQRDFDKRFNADALSIFQQLQARWKKARSGWREERPDTTFLSRLLQTPEFYFEKVPAAQRVFESALRRSDNFYHLEHSFLNDAQGNSLVEALTSLQKRNPSEYSRLKDLLLEADRNKKALTEEGLRAQGLAPETIEAWKAFREIMDHGFDALVHDMKEVVDKYQETGIDLPQIAVIVDGERIAVDLGTALKMMGDMRGYYFPRNRRSGRYALIAQKKGAPSILEFFDTKTFANMRGAELTAKGYQIQKQKSKQTPEDVFEIAGKTIGVQAMINEALGRIGGDGAPKTLKDFGLEGNWERTTDNQRDLVITGPFNKEQTQVFKALGGKFYSAEKGAPRVWHFVGATKWTEKRIVKNLMGAQGSYLETDLLFATALAQQVANVIKGRGFRSHMIKRAGATGEDVWRGYEEDPIKAAVQYARSVAAGLAKKQMALEMVQAITGTDVRWTEFDTYEDYLEEVRNRRIDPASQPNIFHDVKTFMEDMLRNEEFADRVIGVVKGLAVLKYLGARVSAPIVNLTALLTSAPAAMTGYANVPLHKTVNYIGRGIDLYRQYVFGNPETMDPDMAKLFAEIQDKGWDKAQYNWEALSVLQSKIGGGWNTLIEYSMLPFGITEQINRVGTIAGTYLAIKEQASEGGFDHDQALKLAKKVSDRAHGVYGKATLPHFARGKNLGSYIAKAFYVFRKFSHTYLQTMYEFGFSKDRKNRKALLFMAVAPAILGGAGASVVWPVLMGALKSLFDMDDPEEGFYDFIEDALGEIAGNLARFGLFGLGGFGFSLKGSLSIGVTDLPTSIPDILGAPGSVVTDISRGTRSIARGDFAKGVEKMLPTGVASPIRAVREATQGVTTRTNAPVFYGERQLKGNKLDTALRTLSFNPARIAKAREKQWHERMVDFKYAERREEIYSQLKKYFLKSEAKQTEAELDALMKKVDAYNERVKEKGLEGIVPFISVRSIKAAMQRSFRPNKRELSRAVNAGSENRRLGAAP